MSSQVADKLAETKRSGRAALIGYLPNGFPTATRGLEAAKTLIDAGVDILELGIPYTDPIMDGPTIQRAAETALKNGTTPADVFATIRALKEYREDVPVLVMSYFNPIMKYGVDRFAADLAESGGAGIITADLVPDQGGDWIDAADSNGLDRVFLVAPSSTPERLKLVAESARGFIYAASTMGVTGVRAEVGPAAESLVKRTREAITLSANPGTQYVCVGLGVSTPQQAATVGRYADGVIVGSAFVKPLLDENITWDDRLKELHVIASNIADGVANARKNAPVPVIGSGT